MSHHDQSHMKKCNPVAEPALIVVQPQFSFGILVEPLGITTTGSWARTTLVLVGKQGVQAFQAKQ